MKETCSKSKETVINRKNEFFDVEYGIYFHCQNIKNLVSF